jgi:rRNA processing protein Krr1/Pno1
MAAASGNGHSSTFPDVTQVVRQCPRTLVGRLIGKHGVTVKGIQLFTHTVINIEQPDDRPARIVITGSAASAELAGCIVDDVLAGSFKGFAILRGIVVAAGTCHPAPNGANSFQDLYTYVPGTGLFPRAQVSLRNLVQEYRKAREACIYILHTLSETTIMQTNIKISFTRPLRRVPWPPLLPIVVLTHTHLQHCRPQAHAVKLARRSRARLQRRRRRRSS